MAASAGIVAAGAAVASAGSSIIGGLSGGGSSGGGGAGSAQDFRQQASALWNNLQQPVVNKTPLVGQTWLQDYTPTNYTPQTGTLFQSSDDPTSIANQNLALGQMQGLARGGLQPADLIALQAIQGKQAGAASSQAQAIQDQMRARGLGGAGSTEAGMIAANQSAANSANELYNNAMQQAMSRQTAAISAAANEAGNIRTQNNNISQQMAANNNTFNTQTINIQNAAAQAAAANANAAQATNLAGRQGVANNNVTNQNANVALQNAQAQQAFNNQTTQIAGQTNALNGQAVQASAQQAADALNQFRAQQQVTSGLNGLVGAAKAIGGNADGSGGLSTPSWFSNLISGANTSANQQIANPYGGTGSGQLIVGDSGLAGGGV